MLSGNIWSSVICGPVGPNISDIFGPAGPEIGGTDYAVTVHSGEEGICCSCCVGRSEVCERGGGVWEGGGFGMGGGVWERWRSVMGGRDV